MIDIRSFKSDTGNEADNAKTFVYKIVFYSDDLSKLLQDGRTTASLKICIQDQGQCHFQLVLCLLLQLNVFTYVSNVRH